MNDKFINEVVPGTDYKIIKFIGRGGRGLVFLAHSDELNRDAAVKIIPSEKLIGRDKEPPTWRSEIEKANSLRSPAVVKIEQCRIWDKFNSVALISEYVPDDNLENILSKREKIDINFILIFLNTMLNTLHEMKDKNIQHGDLNTGNILVEDCSSYSLMPPPYAFRITDFGVVSATGEKELIDDFLSVAASLKVLLQAINYQDISSKDKFTYNILNNDFLGRHLLEKDVTRDPLACNPKAMFDKLREIDSEFSKMEAGKAIAMKHPFDLLSCEQVGESHKLLRALYSDKFLGLSGIESNNNLVLTGPRGCGKSTVFKSLSITHLMRVQKDNPDAVGYLGVYYRCDDLYFAFPRYQLPTQDIAFNIPLHFLSCTLLSNLLNSVYEWSIRYFKDDFEKNEESLSREIWRLTGLKPPESPGVNSFRSLCSRFNRERERSRDKQRFANDPNQKFGVYFGPEVLIKVTQVVRDALHFLASRPFFFFIDDYSSPKISRDLQKNLNRLLMQRTDCCFFKLSTESRVSFENSDIDLKVYEKGREHILLDLGTVYLREETGPKSAFIADVFKRRFDAFPNYPVSDIEELLGTYPEPNYNDIARSIRKAEKVTLWGKENLYELCSGDIHYIIDLVRQMVDIADGEESIRKESGSPKVRKDHQNRAIREAAGNFIRNLREFPRVGQRLVDVVSAFGNVSHHYLLHLDSKNQKDSPPWQASRIEPYESFELTENAKEIYDELLRYSVFIEDVRGKSRRGDIVPRLWLRRCLIPHFNLTFSKRDSISVEVKDLILLLTSPKDFEIKFKKKGLSDEMPLLDSSE